MSIKQVMLLNDTGTEPHIGCQAVSDAHIRMLANIGWQVKYRYFVRELPQFFDGNEESSIEEVLRDAAFSKRLQSVDAVVVNGEGTIHHTGGAQCLAVLGAAQRLGKVTILVNSVFQEVHHFHQVLRKLDDMCLREVESSQFAIQNDIPNRVVLDSILAAEFDDINSRDIYVDLTDKIAVTDWHPGSSYNAGDILRHFLKESDGKAFYFPLMHGLHCEKWRAAPAVLARSEFIISARHHGVYLAVLARRPFVVLPSNTHKIEGLIKSSGLPIPICRVPNELESCIKFCLSNRSIYEEFFSYVESQKPLSTFAKLGSCTKQSHWARRVNPFGSFREMAKICVEDERDRLRADIKSRPHLWHKPEFWPLGANEYQVLG